MATPTPAPTEDRQPTPPLIHKAAIAGTIISPLVMLLPPRRMDWRFVILSATFSMSSSQLMYDYTGQSVYDRVGKRFQSLFPNELPEAARETQRRLREERMRRDNLSEEDMRRLELSKRNALQRLWFGAEGEEWNKARGEEHQKALQEGKGLSGIIMDQVKEVMPGSKSGEKEESEKGDETKKS